MQGHDAIAKSLADHDIDTVFAVLGDGNLFIGEALARIHGVRLVAATHEANAVLMAEGFAKATGRLGVATVTHGPGLTNTITALFEATKGSTPLLLVAGDTPTEDRHHLQNIPQRELITATGAGFQQVLSPRTFALDVAEAVRRAHTERRPIVLNVPLDFEWEQVDEPASPPPGHHAVQAVAPDPEALDRALGIVASASRPIVLAGRGAVRAGAHDALLRLAERLGAPVATSLLGTGYFRGDPFDLGIFGTLATPVAGEAIASADCVVSFGASLNVWTTDQGALLAGKRVVQCDLDPRRIGSTVPVDAGVVGDAAKVAEAMTAMLEEVDHQPASFRSPDLARRLSEYSRAASFEDLSTSEAIDPRTFTHRLDETLPAERTVVVDAGRFMLDALTLPVPDPMSLVTTHAFGSIGLGMATAVGVGVARPDRPVVLCIGDGGFMMGAVGELHTAVEHGLDLIVLLYNDGSYGAEHIQLWAKQMDTAASMHHWPSFTAVAESMGYDAVSVHHPDDLGLATEAIKNRRKGRPVLIEAKLDPEMVSRLGIHR